MQELLEKIVRGIVNNPDEVSVVERESVDFPGLTILEITVADADKGILIGRRGRTINAIRDIMTISAIRNDRKIKVLVKEDRDGGDRGMDRGMDSGMRDEAPAEHAPSNEPEQSDSDVEDMLSDDDM
ncbi:MAG: KH domain-containing protein [Candidatus Dojkabacteria bacterium]|nr:MAG: KH domain-containing protein [Candidatus Dojkabacteria bacterium]